MKSQKSKFKIQNSKLTNFSLCLYVSVVVISLFSTSIFAQKKATKSAPPQALATVFNSSTSPLVSLRIQFLTGSIDDPKGKEGLANLTATMLAQGGSKQLSYDEIIGQFYPMATGFGAQIDKEMTTFGGATHVDNLDKYWGLVRQMLLEPGFREDDFKRLKQDAINFLKVNLRESNDEELGKERLYNLIYTGHAYQHHSVGTVSSLEKITLPEVKDFYGKHYTQANLVIGLSGGFSTKFSKELYADFQQKLATGKKVARNIPIPKLAEGMKIDIVQRETRATAIRLAFRLTLIAKIQISRHLRW